MVPFILAPKESQSILIRVTPSPAGQPDDLAATGQAGAVAIEPWSIAPMSQTHVGGFPPKAFDVDQGPASGRELNGATKPDGADGSRMGRGRAEATIKASGVVRRLFLPHAGVDSEAAVGLARHLGRRRGGESARPGGLDRNHKEEDHESGSLDCTIRFVPGTRPARLFVRPREKRSKLIRLCERLKGDNLLDSRRRHGRLQHPRRIAGLERQQGQSRVPGRVKSIERRVPGRL